MELFTLKCKQCGSPIKYVSGTDHLKCAFCGTEYLLSRGNNEPNNGLSNIDYQGRGTLFTAKCPQGWNYRIFDEEKFSRLAPICKGLEFTSGENASLILYPFTYYRNFSSKGILGSGITLRRNYQFDLMTFTRFRQLPPIEQYAQQILLETFPAAKITGIKPLNDLDQVLQARSINFNNEATKKLGGKVETNYGKFLVNFTLGQNSMAALFATIIAQKEGLTDPEEPPKETKPQQPKEAAPAKGIKGFWEFGMQGGLIGAKLKNKGVDTPKFDMSSLNKAIATAGPNWGHLFDIILVSNEEIIEGCNQIFNDFVSTIQYGPLYYALGDQELQNAQQVMIDGQRQRQQNAFAAAQKLHQTQSQTSNIINQGYADRSQRMDATRQKYSEGLRGVNTYETSSGRTIEADVKFERVYENNGTYAGTTDTTIRPDSSWVELKKKS